MTLSPPRAIDEQHLTAGFDSGAPSLDDWLRRRALANHRSGASRVFVVEQERRVIAYYALASGSVAAVQAGGSFRRNMPDPIPVVFLGRLAVDREWHGRGIGRPLVGDAGKRVIAAADEIGIRGLLVHALDDSARGFYLSLGFQPSPFQPMTLMATLASLRASL